MRPLLESTRISIGSGRPLWGCQSDWLSLLTFDRNALPAADLFSRDTDAPKAIWPESCFEILDFDGFMALCVGPASQRDAGTSVYFAQFCGECDTKVRDFME